MNREIIELREVVTKLVPMLTGKGLRVTMRGTRAYVRANAKTNKPELVNIPSIPDNATSEFISAIQGFIDHEVGHVLHTDWKYYGGDGVRIALNTPEGRALSASHNSVEDPYVEREQMKLFPGSKSNLTQLHDYFLKRITTPALDAVKGDTKKEFSVLWVPAVRALSGQAIFQEFMDAGNHWEQPMVKAVVMALSDETMRLLKHARNTEETLLAAQEIHDILFNRKLNEPEPEEEQPQPPEQQGDDDQSGAESEDDQNDEGESEDKPEQPAGEGDGDGERDHSESDDEGEAGPGEDGKDGGEEEDGEDAGDADGDGDAEGDEDGDDSESDGDEAADDAASDDADGDEAGDGDAGRGDEDQADELGDDAEEGEGGEADAAGEDDADGADAEDGDDAEGGADDAGGDDDAGDADEGDDSASDGAGAAGEDADAGGDAGGEQAEDSDDLNGGERQAQGGGSREDDDGEAAADGEGEDDGFGGDAGRGMFDLDASEFQPVDLSNALQKELTEMAMEAMGHSDYSTFTRDEDRIEVFDPDTLGINVRDEWVPAMEDEVRHMIGPMQKDIERMMASQSYVIRTPGHTRGKLHGPSLYRVPLGDPRAFTQREEHRSKDTAVMLLIDNSGSMHGQELSVAMHAGYALASTLERVNIANQVMGFTTGSLSRSAMDALRNDPMAYSFSRTCTIVMPIFKEFGERVTPTVKRRIAAQINAQVGMETNVDGESLEYAAMALMRRTERRKVMLVMSDGQPVGNGTRQHLTKTVENLTKAGIETIGIGINTTAVQSYYPRSMVLNNVADLPKTVMGELKRILTN
ncbi:cobaltochelatase CobT-related protein [Paracoccus litorisediminis]|uniref:VWA domain-containing protein n=1 Tax=Paracoccus litorisediminis TaxID=2006130 RepID=A0A844HME1_9RHOB|nr:VWA domain-containing protein [Paracoccus litorisediminis]MTH61090.1 VWA domain-containing protein [Paracoccus litorisediminis]